MPLNLRARLTVDVGPELSARLRAAAAAGGRTPSEWTRELLQHALAQEAASASPPADTELPKPQQQHQLIGAMKYWLATGLRWGGEGKTISPSARNGEVHDKTGRGRGDWRAGEGGRRFLALTLAWSRCLLHIGSGYWQMVE